MLRWMSIIGGCAVAAWAQLAPTPANAAGIVFCSEFAQSVFVAVAYPQDDGNWISRGWMGLDKGECASFDTALTIHTFYFRAETTTYKQGGKSYKNIWATNDGQFVMYENSNFNLWQAQKKVLDNSTLANFSKGGDVGAGAISAKVTFEADGVHSTAVTYELDGIHTTTVVSPPQK
jgi:uncharacterized membrane protein